MKYGDLVFSSELTSIGRRAFNDCAGLTSVEVPGTVKTIGDYAFEDCTSLKSAVIKDGVENLGNHIFNVCTALEEVTLPYAGSSLTAVNKADSSENVSEDTVAADVSVSEDSKENIANYKVELTRHTQGTDRLATIVCKDGQISSLSPLFATYYKLVSSSADYVLNVSNNDVDKNGGHPYIIKQTYPKESWSDVLDKPMFNVEEQPGYISISSKDLLNKNSIN